MIEGLLTNPIVLLLAASIIVMSLMFLFVGRKKKPKKKIEKAIEPKKETKTEEKASEEPSNIEKEKMQKEAEYNEKIAQIDKNFDKIEEIDAGNSKGSEKKVTKIYVRKPQNKILNDDKKDDREGIYDDLSQRAEFVKTSKTVSKFGGFKTHEEIEAEKEQIEEAVKEEIENCDVCKEVSTHFDHSRRISNSVKNDDFDNLFASHLSEHYMNIDAERHLSGGNDNIFKRAEELIQNGETRALDPASQEVFNNLKNDKEKLRFWFEQNRLKNQQNEVLENVKHDEEFNIDGVSLKYMIMAETLLKRKKKSKK